MLTQIVNAQARRHAEVLMPFSKIKWNISEILKEKKLIEDIDKKKRKSKKSELVFMALKLKYVDGRGVIGGFKMISKPSRRIYSGKNNLKPVRQGYGISVVSTPKGLMVGDEARKAGVGGEVIFEIW